MNYNQEQPSFVDAAFRSDAVAAETVQETEQSFTSYVDTEDIINQIGEYVKIHQSEGLSEMEISLNPESLGNIHLQVASKEGMITATITAQNETVRDALMVQAMVLKDELSEQGLKVEAVEVTVASHEFERNMKDGGEEAQNLFEQQVRKQTRRRIVLDNLMQAEDLLADENLTDAERLQIDMMAKSGNSVDFTA
jgi:flagellar hook-length control protein FliK